VAPAKNRFDGWLDRASHLADLSAARRIRSTVREPRARAGASTRLVPVEKAL